MNMYTSPLVKNSNKNLGVAIIDENIPNDIQEEIVEEMARIDEKIENHIYSERDDFELFLMKNGLKQEMGVISGDESASKKELKTIDIKYTPLKTPDYEFVIRTFWNNECMLIPGSILKTFKSTIENNEEIMIYNVDVIDMSKSTLCKKSKSMTQQELKDHEFVLWYDKDLEVLRESMESDKQGSYFNLSAVIFFKNLYCCVTFDFFNEFANLSSIQL